MGLTISTARIYFKTTIFMGCIMFLGSAAPLPFLQADKSAAEQVNTEYLVSLLQELLYARGPVGQEDEVRDICEREMKNYCDEVSIDEAGNVIGLIRGKSKNKEIPIVRVMAHTDEISMIVKRVNSDGTFRVNNLGGLRAGIVGMGPVDILADSGILPGVMSVGPLHTTAETPKANATRTEFIDWNHVYIFTRKSPEELKQAGVHAGTKVVISRDRRKILELGDCIGGYNMDDRAGIAIIIGAAAMLKENKVRLANDVYIAMTSQEEIGAFGASYAARTLPGDVTVAVDLGPATDEYKTELTSEPIVAYGDADGVYSKSVSDRLFNLAKDLGMDPQTAVWASYGTDASISKRYGQSGQTGLLCIATENTHGYEIIPREGLMRCARVLSAFLQAPVENGE